jgi:hypothetical protein
MPIQINLLAEAQAAEETRRKDPVKRAILGGVLIVCAVLVWSSTIQVKILSSKNELNNLQASWKSMEKNYQTAVDSRRKFLEAEEKLTALQQLTTNRFLWGSTFNALQQTLNGVDDVQVTRIRTEQSYTVADDPHPKPGVPKGMTATEKIVMTIEAVDSSPQPGAKINSFKAAIASEPYFQGSLMKTNGVTLLSFSPPQMDAAGRNAYVRFSLQCLVPEKVR